MSMDKSSVLERIQKLFALADASRNPSEHEVLAALSAAKKLMVEHDIEEAEVLEEKGIKPSWSFETGVAAEKGRLFQWEKWLGLAVGKITTTQCIMESGARRRILFLGHGVDVAIAVALYKALSKSADHLASRQTGEKTSFKTGFARAVLDRSNKPVDLKPKEQKCYALVSTEKKDWLKKSVGENFPRLRNIKSVYRGSNDPFAYGRGYAEGKKAQLSYTDRITGG